MAIIVLETCNGCKVCEEVCPFHVFEVVDGFAVAVNGDDCIECCACVEACPEEAIIVSGCG